MRSSLLRVDDDLGRNAIRSFCHDDVATTDLVDAKAGRTVSVCLPARNEADTVGPIVEILRTQLQRRLPLVDEILVIDDHSTDDTAAVARRAGARVVDASGVLADYGEGHGKGEVLWKSLYVCDGDLVVWCDADIRSFDARFVTGILGPLLTHDDVHFVKGHYDRPDVDGEGGGRVTELMARPLLSMLFPELCEIRQPLSGEYGGTRELLEQLPFVQGYGVDVGLLIDISTRFGVGGIAQVDLEVRHHRNRPLIELSPQAMAVAQTILHKARPELVDAVGRLLRPDLDDVVIDVRERPALVEIATYLAKSA